MYKGLYHFTAVIILLLLGLIAYSNSFHNSFHFDDVSSIINCPALKDITNVVGIWNLSSTRFITHLSLALNYKLGGLEVFGYHVFNLLVHLGSGILAWWLVLLTLNTPALKKEPISAYAQQIAFFSSAIFLVHPIQTQPVNYIIQRATLLAAFFYLASLSLYVRARLTDRPGLYYALSLLTAFLSMLSKEIAVSLPLSIALYEFCFLKSRKSLSWKRIIPFLIVLLIILLIILFTKSIKFDELRGAVESKIGVSAYHYFLTQLRVKVTYLRLLFLPISQNLDYDYPISKSFFDIPVLLSALLLIAIFSLGCLLFHRRRLLSFAIFWFFITLLPESSIIPIIDVIFEHRLYLPMLGFSLFVSCGIYYLLRAKWAKIAPAILALLVICYSVMTYQRNKVWKDEFSLWNDNILKSPLKARPYFERADAHFRQGSLERAVSDYNKTVELDPGHAKAYNHRAIIFQKQGKFDQAISDYDKAISLIPLYCVAYNNRGVAYLNKGNIDQAIADYSRALDIDPNYPDAYSNRANAYLIKGYLDSAISDCNRALEINPGLAQAYENRAKAYFIKGAYSKSWKDVRMAQGLGYGVNPEFIAALKQASGREK
jgi:Tfp pilus assembly protein PilF